MHVDGLRERHDAAVDREGVFDEAVAAIRLAKEKGFRVTTNSTFFNTDSPKTVRDVLDFLNDDLGVDAMMISPAYAYEKAPDQEHFLGVEQTQKLFADAFGQKHRKKWRLNHSPLFLDFLEGKSDFQCTAWGVPSYSVLGLAAAVLPDGGRVRQHLQGADRNDRLGCVRTGARTSAAPTAWPTAATSPARLSPPWGRCASPYVPWCRHTDPGPGRA